MSLPPVTYDQANAMRDQLDAQVEALNAKLGQVLAGNIGPVILGAVADAILSVAAQEDVEAREAIVVKLRCLVEIIKYMPAHPLDFAGLTVWLESPECRALQERILMEGRNHG
jgi:hypothetical protein